MATIARIGLWLVLACGVAAGAEPADAEAAMAARALAERNAALDAEVVGLREQVRKLTLSLAEALAEVDRLKLASEGASREAVAPKPVVRADEIAVLDVNPALDLVVLGAGAVDGVRAGMKFALVRGDVVIADAIVVDVRDRMSGATLERRRTEQWPQRGDRAVVAR